MPVSHIAIFCLALLFSSVPAQADALGAITIQEISASGTDQLFQFQASYASDPFFLSHSTISFSGYLPLGSYEVRQINIPAGWVVTNMSCLCFQSNIPGNDISNPCQSTWAVDLPSATLTIELAGSELLDCTFVDTFEPCTGPLCEPSCGNGVLDPGEACDNGSANSDSAFGPGSCTTRCESGPIASRCVMRALELSSCNQAGGSTSQGVLALFMLAAIFWMIRKRHRQAP